MNGNNIRKIITDRKALSKPSAIVTKEDNIEEIIDALRDTLIAHPTGLGLSAPQIEIYKQVSLIRMPTPKDNNTIEMKEIILINPKITDKQGKCRFDGEGCLSFPGIRVSTDRYIYIAVDYDDIKLERKTGLFQDINAICIQHEVNHLQGKTIFDIKHRASN